MSVVKISQLPDAAALSGAERLPLVQEGQTVAASVAALRNGLLPSTHAGSGGDSHPLAIAGGSAGFLSGSDKAKLDGVQAGATANGTDAFLLNRANQSGTQTASTIAAGGTLSGVALAAKGIDTTAAPSGTVVTVAATGNVGIDTATPAYRLTQQMSLDGFNRYHVMFTGDEVNYYRLSLGYNNSGTPSTPVAAYGGSVLWERGGGFGSSGGLVIGTVGSNAGPLLFAAEGLVSWVVEADGAYRPAADNVHSIGTAANRPAQVYATTGIINTSDERDKDEIAPVDPALATALVHAFDPVTFKWRDIDHPAVVERRGTLRQKTERVTVVRDVVERIDGVFVRRQVEESVQQPVFTEHRLHDDTGIPLMDEEGRPILHREPVMEEIIEDIETTAAYRKANHRTHWGFIAQQVEQGLCTTLGLDPTQARLRFAGLVHDGEADRYGLREAQFIPILWATLRDLLDRVKALEGERQPG
jgi:hypothetical protein